MSRSSPSESTRTREVLRCLEPFESTIQALDFSDGSPARRTAVGCDDTALAAFAQLGALRLNAQRCMISLLSKDTEYVLAESTRTLSLQSDLVHAARDALWLGTTRFPKDQGLAALGVDEWSTIRNNRQTPDVEDHYYTDGTSPHWLIVSDLRQEQHKQVQDRLLVKCAKALRFYCAIPIRTASGVVVGSYSVFDDRPRYGISAEEMEFLEDIADTVMGHLEAKRAALQRKRGDRLIKGLALFNEGKDSLRDWWLHTYSRNVRGEGQRRRRRSISDEDMRNERADDELGMTYRADEQGSHTPVRMTTAVKDMAEPSKAASDQLLPPPDSVGVKSGHLSGEKFEGFDLGREVKAAFARGSNLIRESISSEGVVFVDADFARSKHAIQNPGETSSTDPESDSPSSCSDREAKSQHDLGPDRKAKSQRDLGPDDSDCALLGFSTKIRSSLRGFSGSQKHASLPKAFVRSLIRRYPQGKVFNYADGKALSSSSGTDLSDASNDSSATSHSRTPSDDSSGPNKRKRRRSREAVDAMTIARVFSDPRSVAFLPLWDSRRERWRSAAFVWNNAPNRLMDKTEDVTYLAAFGNSLMSELSRLDAIAADQAKATFISSVSHELRSPLHGVLAGVELLQESNLNAFQEEMTTTISMAGKTLLDTINNILDFTKINSFTDVQRKDRRDRDSGRNTSFKTADMGEVGVSSSVDLAMLTENVVDTTVTAKSFQASKQQQADQPLDVDGQNQPVVVVLNIAKRPNWNLNISPGSWTRVLTNLLGNSLKYTNTGLITVRLHFRPAEKSNKTMVLLTIEDTGQGISSEYLRHHLYTPFMQENTHAVGTGLGLSIVKQIVHDFGGRIEFESELGRGTKVVVSMLTEFDEDACSSFDIPKKQDRNLRLAFSTSTEGSDREGRAKTVKSIASRTCRDWMECQSEFVTVKDGATDCDALVVTEREYEEWAQKRRRHGSKDLPLIVLSSISSSSSAARQSAAKDAVFINQPFGPRKLSRALAAALHGSPQTAYHPPEQPSGDHTVPPNTRLPKYRRPESPRPQTARTEPLSIDNMPSTPSPPSSYEGTDEPRLRKVLLVEDNAINMKLLVAAMRKLKRSHDVAENGLEAVSKYALAPHTFALILMDISMPVMDGFVATETIRALEAKNDWPRCPIIALTGVGDAEAKKRAFLNGVDTYLMKPASMQKLRGIVEELKN